LVIPGGSWTDVTGIGIKDWTTEELQEISRSFMVRLGLASAFRRYVEVDSTEDSRNNLIPKALQMFPKEPEYREALDDHGGGV
jgi:hypothetical protein